MGAMRPSNWGKKPKGANSRNSKNERNNVLYTFAKSKS